MTTDISIREDFELFERLESSRLCLPLIEECDNEATWLIIKPCCQVEIPLCDVHAEEIRVWLESVRDANVSTRCTNCGSQRHPNDAVEWKKL